MEPISRSRRGYTLVFNPQDHQYILRDTQGQERVLPSVTRILSLIAKPKVQEWAMDLMAQHILDRYTPDMTYEDFLYFLHESRYVHLQGGHGGSDWYRGTRMDRGLPGTCTLPYPTDPRARGAVESFLEWWQGKERLFSEFLVAHPHLGFAGRIDLLLTDGTLVDFKTSKALYPEYDLQLGGYALALEWWKGISPKKGLLVRPGKDGSFETREVPLPKAKEASKLS